MKITCCHKLTAFGVLMGVKSNETSIYCGTVIFLQAKYLHPISHIFHTSLLIGVALIRTTRLVELNVIKSVKCYRNPI